MRQLFITTLLVFASIINLYSATSYELGNSNFGTEFWFALPQNEDALAKMKELNLEVYVVSCTTANVKYEIPSKAYTKEVVLEAFKPYVFSKKNGEIDFDMEITQSEVVSNKTFHISSDEPIAVFLISEKEFSAEGFMVLPVSAWGKKYYHSSYTDLNEGQYDRAGGFIILAKENETSVQIELNGKGTGDLKWTIGKKKIGDIFYAQLNTGEAYLVRGIGRTKNFDMTGTKITANKPIGLISYHMRCMIPVNADDARQFIAEMMPPVESWGKEFLSVEFQKKKKGDYFRLIASEDNTKWEVKYYDMTSKNLIKEMSGTLSKAGDFYEYNGEDIESGKQKESIRGIASWKAEKPVMLIQYGYSKPWDGDLTGKPVMVIVPPKEQYIPSTIIQAPIASLFNLNEMNIMAIGSDNDNDTKAVNSIRSGNYPLDGIEKNRVPGTNLWWARDAITGGTGARRLTSDTKIAGIQYGFSVQNSYAWIMATGTNMIDIPDLIPPTLTIEKKADGKSEIVGKEEKSDIPENYQSGLSKLILLPDRSINVSVEQKAVIDATTFVEQAKLIVKTVDTKIASKAVFAAIDRYGNVSIDSSLYSPGPDAGLLITDIDFGEVSVNKSRLDSIRIESISGQPIQITSISGFAAPFSISSVFMPMTINPGQVVYIKGIQFAPTDSGQFETNITLTLSPQIGDADCKLTGRGYNPVSVDDEELVDLHPNPASDYVIIGNRNAEVMSIELFDLIGNSIEINELFADTQKTVISLKGVIPGIYLVKVKSNGKILIKRLIIN